MRDISSARYISLAALIALSLTLMIVIVEMPMYVNHYHATLTEEESRINYACPSLSFFNGAGICFFAYTN